ncbi:hypothetical protein SuNHUV7_40460 (plasmid) [Pseudoseohaeicola sp. NH-UV-7]|uniref:hypothetical protein n=1 Tax=Sulfitobacter sp. TBRI5 TaxID=2989732 RepID=UPI003A70FA04
MTIEKKSLAELKAEKEAADAQYYAELKAMMKDEFHSVWEDVISPALHSLKKTMDEVTDRFEDFEEEFKGYLRGKEPDVDVKFLTEIFGDSLTVKEDSNKRQKRRTFSDKEKKKHLKEYEKAEDKAAYREEHDLTYNHFANWKKAFLAAEGMMDKP